MITARVIQSSDFVNIYLIDNPKGIRFNADGSLVVESMQNESYTFDKFLADEWFRVEIKKLDEDRGSDDMA